MSSRPQSAPVSRGSIAAPVPKKERPPTVQALNEERRAQGLQRRAAELRAENESLRAALPDGGAGPDPGSELISAYERTQARANELIGQLEEENRLLREQLGELRAREPEKENELLRWQVYRSRRDVAGVEALRERLAEANERAERASLAEQRALVVAQVAERVAAERSASLAALYAASAGEAGRDAARLAAWMDARGRPETATPPERPASPPIAPPPSNRTQSRAPRPAGVYPPPRPARR